jgi:hypothetical protein
MGLNQPEFACGVDVKFATMEIKIAASTIDVGEDTSQRPAAAEMEFGASARRGRPDAYKY